MSLTKHRRLVIAVLIVVFLFVTLVWWLQPTITITKTVHFDNDFNPVSLAIRDDASVDRIEPLLMQDRSFVDSRMGGKLPIHLAVEKQRLDVVKILLKYGADVNAKVEGDWGGSGNTAICFAVYNDDPLMISLLIENGADVEIHDAAGRSLRDVAIELAGKKVQELISAELERRKG